MKVVDGSQKTVRMDIPIEVVRSLAGLRVHDRAIFLRKYNMRIAWFCENTREKQISLATLVDMAESALGESVR